MQYVVENVELSVGLRKTAWRHLYMNTFAKVE